jgi:hypothetical protein
MERNRMFKSIRNAASASVILMALLFISLSGCKSPTPKFNLDFQVTTQSADDVLTIYLITRDRGGNIVEQKGELTVKMWEKTSSNPPATGVLVGEWDNLNLDKAAFHMGKGLLVDLLPNDAFSGKMGQQTYIQFDLAAEGETATTSGIVILGDLPTCCGSTS